LIHVLAGSGQLGTEHGVVDLVPGALLWLPKRSRRQFTAGTDGLRYLTVHQKREILPLTPAVRQAV
jgi:quercetin dioxygenase-like cupin family protein